MSARHLQLPYALPIATPFQPLLPPTPQFQALLTPTTPPYPDHPPILNPPLAPTLPPPPTQLYQKLYFLLDRRPMRGVHPSDCPQGRKLLPYPVQTKLACRCHTLVLCCLTLCTSRVICSTQGACTTQHVVQAVVLITMTNVCVHLHHLHAKSSQGYQ